MVSSFILRKAVVSVKSSYRTSWTFVLLAKRILPVIQFKGGQVVKSVSFNTDRRFGDVGQFAQVYRSRGIDELILIDVAKHHSANLVDFSLITRVARMARIPMTYGGGISDVSVAGRILQSGIERIVVGGLAYEDPGQAKKLVRRFGRSATVGAVDYFRNKEGQTVVRTHGGQNDTGLSVEQAISFLVEEIQVGEVLLTSIDQDGARQGYDNFEFLSNLTSLEVPIVVNGGCWTYEQMREAFRYDMVWGCAAASMFMFSSRTPLGAARFLSENFVNVRIPERLGDQIE
jgi:cyclase